MDEAMVGTKVVSIPETANHEAAMGEKTLLYQTVEKVVHHVVTRGTVNELIHMNVDTFSDLQHFVQHLTSNLIKYPLFNGPITHLVKQYGQVAVADEAKSYDQSMTRANQDKKPLHLDWDVYKLFALMKKRK